MSTPYSPGLEGVTAGISAISEVDADLNQLFYRGYEIHDLVEHCAFDEVAYLLLFGSLPTQQEFDEFMRRVQANRDVPPQVLDLYRQFPKDAHPMDTLKAIELTILLVSTIISAITGLLAGLLGVTR